MVGFTKLAVHSVLCNSSEVRAFTKDRRKLGLMALKIQIFISKLLVKYYILRIPCFVEWTSFSIFFSLPTQHSHPPYLHKTARSMTKGISLKTLSSLLENELS